MVASELIVEGDDEELALNLNGKKKKLKRKDFEESMRKAKIEEKAMSNIFKKMSKFLPKWHDFIELSFLPDEVKIEYHQLINSKSEQMGLLGALN